MDHNNNRVHRVLVSPSPPPPPSPPLISFIAALAISMLIFMCIYVFSAIVSAVILLALSITSVFFYRFIHDRPELDIEMRERTTFYDQNSQRVVRIFDKLFWVVEERSGNRRQQGLVRKLIGSVVRFGSQALQSSGCSDCAICLEGFKEGEECLVFPICGHLFHMICIQHWLENKLTCPICRHCIPSTVAMIRKTRSIEQLANLV